MSAPPPEDIELELVHPQGDLIFLVGTKKILVHSLFLKTASPVWTAQLSGNFAEGRSLSQTEPEEIVVDIGDRDPEAFLDLQRLVHLKPKHKVTPTARRVYEIALLADQYRCPDVVELLVKAWASHYIHKQKASSSELGHIAAAVVAVQLSEEFRDVSRRLMFEIPSQMRDIFRGEDPMLTPFILREFSASLARQRLTIDTVQMENHRNVIKEKIRTTLVPLIANVTAIVTDALVSPCSNKKDRAKRAVTLLGNLRQLTSLEERSLSNTLFNVKDELDRDPPLEGYCFHCDKNHGKEEVKLWHWAKARVEELRGLVRKGFCLTCARRGDDSPATCTKHLVCSMAAPCYL